MNDRARWNDQAIDGLSDKLDDVEDQVEALRKLPERMSELRATCEASHDLARALRTDQIRGDEREDRRVAGLHRKLDERFDRIDVAHARTVGGVDWRTVLAVVTGVSVPLAVAVIASGGSP